MATKRTSSGPAKQSDPYVVAQAWNERVNVGDEVDYYSHPGAAPQRFRTETLATILGGHTAIVWLKGKSGCVATDACKPVITPQPQNRGTPEGATA